MTSLLLSPIQVGRRTVRNRVVSTAHGAFLDFYRPGESGDRFIAYEERRAAGGTGLLILQPIHVHRSSAALNHHVYDPEDMRRKFARLAAAVHRHGATAVVQLVHFGAQFTSDAREDLGPLWAMSPLQSPEGESAHEMFPEEIEEVIEGYARTAALAVESGLDGVEIHGVHGYLVQQSYSPWGNQRQDEWGRRTRFASEVIRRVRAAAGDAIVGLRIAVDDWRSPEAGGLGPEGLREVARELVATGHLDYLNHSEGSRSSHYARAIGTYRHPYGEFLPMTSALKETVGGALPVVGVGRIVTPDLAEQALRDGTCDLVGMTRAQIADPDLVAKLARGEGHRIRPCVGANQGCVDRMELSLPITCFHNPEVGREAELAALPPAARSGHVVVVGAGPAGLKAAEVAARRGHRVTLLEAAAAAGGRLRLVGGLGPAAELLASVLWLETELAALGVEVRLGRRADASALRELGPDAVILATGAVPQPGALGPSDGSVPVISVDEAAAGTVEGQRADLRGEEVLVVDQLGNHDVGLATERLAREGARVTIATPALHLASHVGFTHRRELLESVFGLGCAVETSTVFTGIRGGRVGTRHVYSKQRQERPFALVVAGIAPRALVELRPAALELGVPVLVAGDAVAPRTALHAFREGYDAGRAVEAAS